jgi:hypothetical protein
MHVFLVYYRFHTKRKDEKNESGKNEANIHVVPTSCSISVGCNIVGLV